MHKTMRVDSSFWRAQLTEDESRRERVLQLLVTMEEQADNIDVDPLALRMARQQASGRSGKGITGRLMLPPRRHLQGR